MNDYELGKQHAKEWLDNNPGPILRSYPGLLQASKVLKINNQEEYLDEVDKERFNLYSNGWHDTIIDSMRG